MKKDQDYWKVPLEGKHEELDTDLIQDLNEKYDDIRDDQNAKSSRKLSIKIIALVTVIVFSVLVFNPLFTVLNLPSFNFIEMSLELLQEPENRELREGVVEISAGNSRGTGFNIHEDGLIVTNAHVVDNARLVKVTFYRGNSYNGIIEASFPEIDLALICIQGKNLPTIKIETGKELEPGETVTVIGNPLWFSRIVMEGVVAGKTALRGWDIPVLLVRAPIYQGSSGSPVINHEGRVAAVIFATLTTQTETEETIGLAVPIAHLLETNSDIIEEL
jgi:S1-C subfamily serine protease